MAPGEANGRTSRLADGNTGHATGRNNPTAECQWLHDRIETLEIAIKKGDTLGTREELARWRGEFRKKECHQYDY